MEDIKKALEFDQIENSLLPFFAFEDNQVTFRNLNMITDHESLDREHALLKEVEEYYRQGYSINLEKNFAIANHMTLLSKDGNLNIKGLSDMRAFLNNITIFKTALGSKDKLEKLHHFAEDLTSFSNISNLIKKSVLPDLTLADDASSNLFDIRRKLNSISGQFNSAIKAASVKYGDYLAQKQEVMKEGLPTLAVKANNKSKVKGLVAAISNTGGTVFIIPIEVLDIQNKLYALKEAEQDEIRTILKILSKMLKEHMFELQQDYRIILILDSLFARVRFGLSYHGTVASNSDGIYLEDLAHPLIDQDIVVRNTFTLTNKAKILVISGPNAGGKTVLIKAVALACYMNQRGLLVDCLGKAELRLFHDIFFLAGDSQSIMDNLSTFSGHIKSINEALSQVFDDSLFIVDEIGQGTSPLDGEAIGIGVVNYLEKINCFSILTSHYDGLKQKAVEDNACEVGAMIFDEKTIQPTFKYRVGMLGKSYAIEVSKNLGLNKEIVDSAEKYLKEQKLTPVQEILDKVQELQAQNVKLKKDYEEKIKFLDLITKKRENAIVALRQEKQAIYEKADLKIEKIINMKIVEIDAAYKSANVNFSLGEMAKIKGELKKIAAPRKQKITAVHQVKKHKFEKNDTVRVNSMNNSGTITNIDKQNVSVDVGGLVIRTNIRDLEYLPKNIFLVKKTYIPDQYIGQKADVGLECNIIGLYQDEAKEEVEKYLSDCLLMNYHQVRIVHGNGSGKLRTMVWNVLKTKEYVKSYRYGGAGEGGVGATVINLK